MPSKVKISEPPPSTELSLRAAIPSKMANIKNSQNAHIVLLVALLTHLLVTRTYAEKNVYTQTYREKMTFNLAPEKILSKLKNSFFQKNQFPPVTKFFYYPKLFK